MVGLEITEFSKNEYKLFRNSHTKAICSVSNYTINDTEMTNVEGLDRNDQLLLGVPGIAWPFLISGAWCIASSLGFLVLSKYIPIHNHFAFYYIII